MLKRHIKNLFYTFVSPLMRLNSLKIKYFNSFKKYKTLKLHLGPGKKNYINNIMII